MGPLLYGGYCWLPMKFQFCCVCSLLEHLYFLRAAMYKNKYLKRDDFDNNYITERFVQLDQRRLCEGRPTVLPLSQREALSYIQPRECAQAVTGLPPLPTGTDTIEEGWEEDESYGGQVMGGSRRETAQWQWEMCSKEKLHLKGGNDEESPMGEADNQSHRVRDKNLLHLIMLM